MNLQQKKCLTLKPSDYVRNLENLYLEFEMSDRIFFFLQICDELMLRLYSTIIAGGYPYAASVARNNFTAHTDEKDQTISRQNRKESFVTKVSLIKKYETFDEVRDWWMDQLLNST